MNQDNEPIKDRDELKRKMDDHLKQAEKHGRLLDNMPSSSSFNQQRQYHSNKQREHEKTASDYHREIRMIDKKKRTVQEEKQQLIKNIIERCWKGYEPVTGKKPYTKGSCRKIKEEYGAGFEGTKKLKDKYKKDTPGQDVKEERDPRLKRAGVSGFNKPKRTPGHPTKSHIVVAKEGDRVKTIRFGEQGAETAGKPKEGESHRMKMKRKKFKARHARNIRKGKMSAAYWANKEKW